MAKQNRSPVALTLAHRNPFELGQNVEVGCWPDWMFFWYIKPATRRLIRWTLACFGKKIGPQTYTVTEVTDGNTIQIL